MEIVGILDTNTFEIRLTGYDNIKLRGLYLNASMMNHNCCPNTRHLFNDRLQIVLIATRDIPKGTPITASYTQTLQSTNQRRQHLKAVKFFACLCERCSDPSEFGLNVGSIMCPKCHTGKLNSLEPLNESAKWQCFVCRHEYDGEKIIASDNRLVKEIRSLNKETPKELEEFLFKYRHQLHETNTHFLQVKYALTQLYGNSRGFLMNGE